MQLEALGAEILPSVALRTEKGPKFWGFEMHTSKKCDFRWIGPWAIETLW